MPNFEKRTEGDRTHYVLDGQPLDNDDEVLVRLRGNAGWQSVKISGLPDALRVRFRAGDGKELDTTLPFDAEIRWP